MASSKHRTGLHVVEAGFEYEEILDLEVKDFKDKIFIPIGGFRYMSVSVTGRNAVGSSGDVVIGQANVMNGVVTAFSPAKTLTLDIDGEVSDMDVESNARYLVLDLTGMTLATDGRIMIFVNAKR